MNQKSDHIKILDFIHASMYHRTQTRTLSRSKFRSMHTITYQVYVLKLNIKLKFRLEDLSIHLMY